MNISPDKKLFWFLKDDVSLDLSNPSDLVLYVQQVLSRGRFQDVKTLMAAVGFERFEQVYHRIKRFFPREVQSFWEDFIESN